MISKEREIAGKTMRLETGKVARQSNGSVMVTYGETVILAAVNSSKEPREDIDYFPLQVNIVKNIMLVGKSLAVFSKGKQGLLNMRY